MKINKEEVKKAIDQKIQEIKTRKSKKKESDSESSDEDKIVEKPTLSALQQVNTKNKIDKRAESSKKNALIAREKRLQKLKDKKEQDRLEMQQNIENELNKKKSMQHTTSENTPQPKPNIEQENSDSEEEILIINPPPIDLEKIQKKALAQQKQEELYQWIISEKTRKQNKQPKEKKQPSVIINQMAPTVPKLVDQADQILEQKLLNRLTGSIVKF